MPRSSDTWLQDFETKVHSLVGAQADKNGRPVKIAILDSGVDGLHEDIQDFRTRIRGYKSWMTPVCDMHPSGGFRKEHLRNACRDSVGHGTHLAALILRLQPWAHVYVARVTDSARPNVLYVAEAIKWATYTCKVDLISLSLGFDTNIPEIVKVIDAVHSKVTIFAAASNEGLSSEHPAYPARDVRVICVHSAQPNGAKVDDNPPAKGDNVLMTLGQDVSSAWPIREQGNEVQRNTKRCSGSSVATAIMVATAALMIELLRQVVDEPRMQWAAECLGKLDGMTLVLQKLSRDADHHYRYVELFSFLDGSRDIEESIDYSSRNFRRKQIYTWLKEYYSYPETGQGAGDEAYWGHLLLDSSTEGPEKSRSQYEEARGAEPDNQEDRGHQSSIENRIDLAERFNLAQFLASQLQSIDPLMRKKLSPAHTYLIERLMGVNLSASASQSGSKVPNFWSYITTAAIDAYRDIINYLMAFCPEYLTQIQKLLYNQGFALTCEPIGDPQDNGSFSLNHTLVFLYILHVALILPGVRAPLPLPEKRLRKNLHFGNWVACPCAADRKGSWWKGKDCPNEWNFANGKKGLVRSKDGQITNACKVMAVCSLESNLGDDIQAYQATRAHWMHSASK